MAAGQDKTSRLKTQAYELCKQYHAYDGNGRVTDIYTAAADTVDGGPCTRVQYTYVDASSVSISKMLESDALWDATWDM